MPVPTIDDVATAAGVSKATVSRVLNGDYTYIRAETRQRVQQAIDELGYRPSSVARSLTSKRTQTLGMLISDVGNPFYDDVIHGVEDETIQHGYNTFLGNTNYDLARGLALVQSFIDRRVDGILIMSSSMTDDWLTLIARSHTPVVVVDWQVHMDGQITAPAPPLEVVLPPAVIDAVGVNFNPGLAAAVDHLMGLGHQRYGFVSGPLTLRTMQDRLDTFRTALAEHGLHSEALTIVECGPNIEGGRQAARELFNRPLPPTAVMAANDLIAVGVSGAARAAGLRVPQDVSIIGLDDIWLAAQSDPPLTTVALPRYEIGSLAARMLFDRLKNPDHPAVYQIVQTELIVRSSTAAVKAGG